MQITDKSSGNVTFDLTPEGFLVKRNSKLARTGGMSYAGEEIDKKSGVYQVYTEADELFSDSTIASYEGMPVTLTHPDGLVVDAKNWKKVSVGHVQNVRRDGDYLVGDVYVFDDSAIDLITKYGIEELSCGQSTDIKEINGKIKKTHIVGNHVAIVPSGRAGSSCRLGDRKRKMKPNIKTLTDSLKKVFGLSKKLVDSDMPEEDKAALEALIAELQAALDSLPEDSLPEEADALRAQISELQAKLDAIGDQKAVDSDGEADALKQQLAELVAENEALKKELEAIKESQAKAGAVADASARFPKVKIGDAKTARDVYSAVLADSKAFSGDELKAMNDSEIKAAYIALCAAKKSTDVGKKLLGDKKPEAINLTAKFGGKKQ